MLRYVEESRGTHRPKVEETTLSEKLPKNPLASFDICGNFTACPTMAANGPAAGA
jgi:hypothetical protein